MRIICIARGREGKGAELAQKLASELGYTCYSREDLVEEATREGIAVGKLETAMLKPHLLDERLALDKEQYLAFATARLCDHALAEDTVYHGRTGHLLLPGVAHVLRIRVVESLEDRIAETALRLRISRDKARQYLEDVDEDVRRWGKTIYDRDWDDYTQYDLVLNLDQLQTANAASALCSMALLPDFQDRPASHQALENLSLAAHARIALARDERTWTGRFRVTASKGLVQVTYRPQDLGLAEVIPDVVRTVPGVDEVSTTLAATNLLWVQERFDPDSEYCTQIIELARNWNAAVDLLRLRSGEDPAGDAASAVGGTTTLEMRSRSLDHGGIEDDEDEGDLPPREEDDGGLEAMNALLSREGVGGGIHMACGQHSRLSDCLDPGIHYYLVVLGNLFLDKGHASRVRQTRELATTLGDALGAPVVEVEELHKAYLSVPRQLIKLAGLLLGAAVIFTPVMLNQAAVLQFLSAEQAHGKILAAVAVALVVPVFAFIYGTFTKGVLRLLHVE